jgi:type I restriction enzyme S subunit
MTTANGWPLVPLGQLLVKNENTITLVPTEKYREVTIRLWGNGVVLRREVLGAEIAAGRRFRVSSQQFIASRIDARNGAMGIVPPELDGAVVTNDFPSFDTNGERLLPDFIGWLSKTPSFVEQCRHASEGTTNRVRLKENSFLRLAITLPPLDEQRRIVAKIERVAARIGEAQAFRSRATEECEILCRSIIRDHGFGSPVPTAMRELVKWRKPDVDVIPTESYAFAGVYCFGRGVFRGQRRAGTEFAYKQLTQLRVGEFVYPKLMAWEGALAVVPEDCDGFYVSPEFPVFTINEDRVLPEVLDIYFRSPEVWPLLSGASTGTNVRRKRLNPNDFLSYRFPLPSRSAQLLASAVRKKLRCIRDFQKQEAQLDALLPALLDRAFKGAL